MAGVDFWVGWNGIDLSSVFEGRSMCFWQECV